MAYYIPTPERIAKMKRKIREENLASNKQSHSSYPREYDWKKHRKAASKYIGCHVQKKIIDELECNE